MLLGKIFRHRVDTPEQVFSALPLPVCVSESVTGSL